MYTRYCSNRRWKTEVLDSSEISVGGGAGQTGARVQGSDLPDLGRGSVPLPEVRVGRPSGAARAAHRRVGADPHLRGDRSRSSPSPTRSRSTSSRATCASTCTARAVPAVSR
jgi:hypothetical protein